MTFTVRFLLAALALSALAGSACAASDPQAVEMLKKLELKYAQVQTIAGAFTQTREDKDFGSKEQAVANFVLQKPNNFRADYQPPDESVNLIAGDTSYRYIPKLRQVERYRFSNSGTARDLNFMLLGFGVKTDDVLAVYDARWLTQGVARGFRGIQLTPRDKKNAAFKYVTILVTDDEKLLPAQFSMEQLDGVRVTANLRLKDLRLGAPVDKSVFSARFPGAEVIDIQ